MSQEHPMRPHDQQCDAATTQSLVSLVSAMQSAVNQERAAGFAGQQGNIEGDQVVVISQTDLSRRQAITESASREVVKENSEPVLLAPISAFKWGNITIGEALEATALTAGHRPVDFSDAAAIQAAEVRATGRTSIVPGGVAAAAQSAATRNARATQDEEKTKLRDILAGATAKLPADKPVTRRDAEGVIGAELRNDPNLSTHPGGVSASVAAAARLNQNHVTHQNK